LRSASGTFGIVCSSNWIASQVGMAILEQGGNAADAAVAVGFTLQVVEPQQVGLGGEAVMLVACRDDEEPVVICGQGPIPGGATIDRFRSFGLSLVPAYGPLSNVVPGAFDAWLLLLRDFGRMKLADVLAPAIFYALNGFPAYPAFILGVRKAEKRLREWPSSLAFYLRDGKIPAPEALIRNPVLAETYRRLLCEAEASGGDRVKQIEAARRAFYSGFVAEAIDRFSARAFADGSGTPHPGFLTGEDLADWHATYERPVHFDYYGHRLFKPGFWSQGPVMLQMLALLKHLGIAEMDPCGAEFVHTFVEAAKLAFADREAWYGDNAPAEIDRGCLLSEQYSAARSALVSSGVSTTVTPGAIADRAPRLPDFVAVNGEAPKRSVPASAVAIPALGDTCHIDVIDREGNIVSATPSGGWLAGSPVIDELGFPLSNRAQMCWLQKGLPSTLVPKKRPRTTLSPTLSFHRDGSRLAFGSRGADMQEQWALQFFLRHVHADWTLERAVEEMPFHSEHWPQSTHPRQALTAKLILGSDFSEDTAMQLQSRGHAVTMSGTHEWHCTCAAAHKRNVMSGAASTGGAAIGH
jgi:gamma-glutamyltranspeptidase / glutathione hydrolase